MAATGGACTAHPRSNTMTPSDDNTIELDRLEDLRMQFAIIAIHIKNIAGVDAVIEDLYSLIHMIEQLSERPN
jgi:hypothetical protein